MTPERTAEIADLIRRCQTVQDCHDLRASIGNEEMNSQTYAALSARIDALRKWEAGQV